MKRLLLVTIMVFMLVGCGNANANNTEIKKPNSNVTESEDLSTEDVQNIEIVETESEENISPYTFTEMNKFMYAKSVVNVRDLPCADGTKLGELTKGQEVNVGGQCNETGWYRIGYNGVVAYVSSDYLVDTKPDEPNEPNKPVAPDEPNNPTPDTPTGEYQPKPDEIVTYGQWRFNRADTGGWEADIKKLAEAGYGVIVDFTTYQGCGILVSTYDDATYQAAMEKLRAHIVALGYEDGQFLFRPLAGCLDDGVYVVTCEKYTLPPQRPSDW